MALSGGVSKCSQERRSYVTPRHTALGTVCTGQVLGGKLPSLVTGGLLWEASGRKERPRRSAVRAAF